MSDVKWCDQGQHPFTTSKEGWVRSQMSMQTRRGPKVVDYDICADCAPSQFGGTFDSPEDDLERRLKEVESAQAKVDREELAWYRNQPETVTKHPGRHRAEGGAHQETPPKTETDRFKDLAREYDHDQEYE